MIKLNLINEFLDFFLENLLFTTIFFNIYFMLNCLIFFLSLEGDEKSNFVFQISKDNGDSQLLFKNYHIFCFKIPN